MIYTLFFSRLRKDEPDQLADYGARATALLDHARENHPGFVDIKSFTAEDGERLTVVRFRDMASHQAWAADPQHVEAKRKGLSAYYSEYRIVICDERRERSWHQR